MKKAQYRLTKLTEVRPYDKNPRIIPQVAVDAVAKSIQAFGFQAPIVVDADGVILAGHTRYKAAQQLGLEKVPVIWQSELSDVQARGYRIADNKVAELSSWDRDALDSEVRELAKATDTELDSLGFSDWELDRILHGTDLSLASALNTLENDLFAVPNKSNPGGATQKPAEKEAPNGPAEPTGQKYIRVLITIPKSENNEEEVSHFLESLTEMTAGIPGVKTETF